MFCTVFDGEIAVEWQLFYIEQMCVGDTHVTLKQNQMLSCLAWPTGQPLEDGRVKPRAILHVPTLISFGAWHRGRSTAVLNV